MNDREIRKLLTDSVYSINDNIFELLENTDLEYYCMLEYYDTGNVYGITFLDISLFCSENDIYEDDEGNFIITEEYLKNKIKNIVNNLNKLNLIK